MPGMPEVTQTAVRDADAEQGSWPLIIFSHGFGGERRQSTFLYSHLASHGYVVAAMDHVGNTTMDMLAGDSTSNDMSVLGQFIDDRPKDCSFVIDRMLAGKAGLNIEPGKIGISGHSFGVWTSLMTANNDGRIKAALPLAPAGGRSIEDQEGDSAMSDFLELNWRQPVAVLTLVAERDSLLPLEGMRDLHNRTQRPRMTIMLKNADHFHFCDRVEAAHDGFKLIMLSMAEDEQMEADLEKMKDAEDLCPGEQANTFTRGLGLAHFDAHLSGHPRAAAWLQGDLVALLARQGADIEVFD
jgi:dienelactone hydrolase